MARSLAQTKHLDTTDCLAWRLCFGNPRTKSQANHGWDGFWGCVQREHRGAACHDAIDQQGTRRALGLRQASRARKEPMLPPDSTLYHVRHPFRPSRFLCMWALVFPLATRDDTKNQAQDVRALRVVWSVVVPFIMPMPTQTVT